MTPQGRSGHPVPVTMTVDVIAVGTCQEFEDGELWDRLHRALDEAGFICEGGESSFMDEADVIEGSPLDARLKEARG